MTVEGTTERVLRLLELLQRRPVWTASELAAELDVTNRSVRRDVERLRALGYPVQATAGVGGGYQLGAGTRLPPLLLDDAEAIATAVSLRIASGGTVAGTGEAALRVLAKLDQVMPPRLRGEVRAVHSATDTLVAPGAEVDPDTLLTLARACRDTVRARFGYTTLGGDVRTRTVEPVRMVATSRRWYLMAWDVDREDWRTFRLDRMTDVTATTWRFHPREHPDPVAYVQESVTASPYRHTARVRVHASADRVAEHVPPQAARIEPETGEQPRAGEQSGVDEQPGADERCLLVSGGDDLDWIALHIARLPFECEILEPPELRDAAARLARRLTGMAAPAGADT
ncbi:putative DNA-binding transcriptional regulator YafY [Prauserella isguenensis]|uniref:Putative DNA-binding transcriptional regulator YafY n=1 Tax=Prauserella isguenensis TaxID=1470180 RepID=A0A839RZZ1_9PSEU|nr:YafY family protein [Prauserella isguenensis]MBB3050614.1 putative DNA-binding transcriptional regulator YafY [Prauserella isguenensis]